MKQMIQYPQHCTWHTFLQFGTDSQWQFGNIQSVSQQCNSIFLSRFKSIELLPFPVIPISQNLLIQHSTSILITAPIHTVPQKKERKVPEEPPLNSDSVRQSMFSSNMAPAGSSRSMHMRMRTRMRMQMRGRKPSPPPPPPPHPHYLSIAECGSGPTYPLSREQALASGMNAGPRLLDAWGESSEVRMQWRRPVMMREVRGRGRVDAGGPRRGVGEGVAVQRSLFVRVEK